MNFENAIIMLNPRILLEKKKQCNHSKMQQFWNLNFVNKSVSARFQPYLVHLYKAQCTLYMTFKCEIGVNTRTKQMLICSFLLKHKQRKGACAIQRESLTPIILIWTL